jgi:uncharacterized protein (DUF2141 family)
LGPVPATVTGVVWNDTNGNGKLDTGEPLLPGVQVYVDSNNNGVFDAGEPQSITDANGRYTLNNLTPGVKIQVRETAPANVAITHAPGGFYNLTPTSGQLISASFGNMPQGRLNYGVIYGIAWNDANGNGILDPGEARLSGIQVHCTISGYPLGSYGDFVRTTDSTGQFSFANLYAGTYQLQEIVPSGFTITHAPAVGYYTINLGWGQAVSASFGNAPLGRIYGIAWHDLNGNGLLDAGEPGFAGTQVYLDINKNGIYDTGDVLQTADANGKYSFDNLTPGNYVLREIVPSGYRVTHAPGTGYWALSLHPGQAISASFGNK